MVMIGGSIFRISLRDSRFLFLLVRVDLRVEYVCRQEFFRSRQGVVSCLLGQGALGEYGFGFEGLVGVVFSKCVCFLRMNLFGC